jgi:hypothetical protein
MAGRLRDLGAPARLAMFAAALALVGGVAALAGAATGHGASRGSDGAAGMTTELPTVGRYRLFFQFKIGGVVHTAPFTVDVQR